jgi:hypothetical protein
MGTLKPGATYIYEKADGITYAREFGAEPSERRIIGWDSRTSDGRSLHDHIMEDKMWGEMRRMAKTNPALQHALDQCIIIYNLSKDHGT